MNIAERNNTNMDGLEQSVDGTNSSIDFNTIDTVAVNGTIGTFDFPYSTKSRQNQQINNSSLQLLTCENADAVAALSQLSEATILPTQSCTPTEIEKMMQHFDSKLPSSHIFVKPGRGTLHSWEYESRKYLYLDLIYKMMPDGFLNDNKRLKKKMTYKDLYGIYTDVTGINTFPPFYYYNKESNIYIKMNNNEISNYISKQFEKVGRLKNKIKEMMNENKECYSTKTQKSTYGIGIGDNEDNKNDEGNGDDESDTDNNSFDNTNGTTMTREAVVGLCYSVAHKIPDRKLAELYNLIMSYEKENCK